MLVMGLILVVYEYPITTLDSDQIETLWVFIRLQVFYATQLWFSRGNRITCRMWAFDLYVYHDCRINFEYIFREYSPYLLHFQQQFYFASLYTFSVLLVLFIWYWVSFVSVGSFYYHRGRKVYFQATFRLLCHF